MKKTLFIITLVVMALAIVPQAQAQTQEDLMRIGAIYAPLMEEIQRQMEPIANQMGQLGNDLRAGIISQADYNARQRELQNEQRDLMRQMNELINEQNAAVQQAREALPLYTQAQLDRLLEIMDQSRNLQAQLHDGRINTAEYERRLAPLNQEIERITAPFTNNIAARGQLREVERREIELWPGQFPGWPRADQIREFFGLGTFTQSSGTRASYTPNPVNYRIIQTGGQWEVVYREMKNQIERITGRTMEVDPEGGHMVWIRYPLDANRGLRIFLYTAGSNYRVVMQFSTTSVPPPN